MKINKINNFKLLTIGLFFFVMILAFLLNFVSSNKIISKREHSFPASVTRNQTFDKNKYINGTILLYGEIDESNKYTPSFLEEDSFGNNYWKEFCLAFYFFKINSNPTEDDKNSILQANNKLRINKEKIKAIIKRLDYYGYDKANNENKQYFNFDIEIDNLIKGLVGQLSGNTSYIDDPLSLTIAFYDYKLNLDNAKLNTNKLASFVENKYAQIVSYDATIFDCENDMFSRLSAEKNEIKELLKCYNNISELDIEKRAGVCSEIIKKFDVYNKNIERISIQPANFVQKEQEYYENIKDYLLNYQEFEAKGQALIGTASDPTTFDNLKERYDDYNNAKKKLKIDATKFNTHFLDYINVTKYDFFVVDENYNNYKDENYYNNYKTAYFAVKDYFEIAKNSPSEEALDQLIFVYNSLNKFCDKLKVRKTSIESYCQGLSVYKDNANEIKKLLKNPIDITQIDTYLTNILTETENSPDEFVCNDTIRKNLKNIDDVLSKIEIDETNFMEEIQKRFIDQYGVSDTFCPIGKVEGVDDLWNNYKESFVSMISNYNTIQGSDKTPFFNKFLSTCKCAELLDDFIKNHANEYYIEVLEKVKGRLSQIYENLWQGTKLVDQKKIIEYIEDIEKKIDDIKNNVPLQDFSDIFSGIIEKINQLSIDTSGITKKIDELEKKYGLLNNKLKQGTISNNFYNILEDMYEKLLDARNNLNKYKDENNNERTRILANGSDLILDIINATNLYSDVSHIEEHIVKSQPNYLKIYIIIGVSILTIILFAILFVYFYLRQYVRNKMYL